MINKLQILSKKMPHQEMQEWIKQEVEPKTQEIQKDGELFGQLGHYLKKKLQRNHIMLNLKTVRQLKQLLKPNNNMKLEV